MSSTIQGSQDDKSQRSTWWIFFWIFLLLFILFFIYLLSTVVSATTTPALNINGTSDNALGAIADNDAIPQVNTLQRCRNLNRVLLPDRYYDPNNNWTVEAINPADALGTNLCLSFCNQVSNNITCETETARYTDCLNKISPTSNSNGKITPAAKNGSIPFYAIGIDRVGCYP